MISTVSRYYSSSETRNSDTNTIALRKNNPSPSYSTYIARDGDSFEVLSTKYLGSPLFFWKIADINPHVPFPDQIPQGTKIRIPR